MKKLILFVIVALTVNCSYGQLNGLRNASKSLKKNKNESLSSTSSSGSTKKSVKVAPMVYNDKMPVSVDLKYILDDTELDDEGFLTHGFYKVTFPPTEDANGPIDYQNSHRFHVQLTKEGTQVYKYPCVEQHTNRLYKTFVPVSANPDYRSMDNKLSEGKYSLNYFLDDSLFYNIPFEVKSITSSDPYAEQAKKFMLDGIWNDLLTIKVNPDDKNLVFYKNIRHVGDTKLAKSIYWFELIKDGKIIAGVCDGTKGKASRSNVHFEWIEINTTVKICKEAGPTEYANLSNLSDGDYEVKFYNNEEISTYKFKISESKIVPEGNQVFDKANSKIYTEGLGKYFFYTK